MVKLNPIKVTLVSKKDMKDKALTGTGLTKRIAERQEKAAEKAEIAALSDPNKALAVLQARKELEEEAKAELDVIKVKSPDVLELDVHQDAAVNASRAHKHFCIIGAAGSGKTTTLKRVLEEILDTISEIDVLDKDGAPTGNKQYSIAFLSFTGRAVQQMKRALPKQYHSYCQTAHSYLGYAPTEEVSDEPIDGEYKTRIIFRPMYNAGNKRRTHLIVIDESSMFPVKLFNEIIEATHGYVRFIFVGDLNQLPPVMDRSILPFAMCKYPTFELKTIHRQALDNPIIANSQRILKGISPIPDKKNFFLMNLGDGSLTASQQILKTVKTLARADKFNGLTDALIVPTNITELGQEYLNEDLVHFFNPPRFEGGVEINKRVTIKAARGSKILAIGDKVMCLSNDKELGITNGQIGVITDITINGSFRDDKLGFLAEDTNHQMDMEAFLNNMNLGNGDAADEPEEKNNKKAERDENQRQASHITTVRYLSGSEEVEVQYQTTGQYSKISLAYAFTCHKSQGGEYPTVVVAFHSAVERMLTREWLYTAVTRARENVYLLCNHRALNKALRRQSIKGNTLEEKAQSFLAQISAKGDVTEPMLPAPEMIGG